MGFYLEMQKAGAGNEYDEREIPSTYWFLFALAGFALACMGLAAATVFRDLARLGSAFDKAILATILMVVPLYFFFGLKLSSIRRFVKFQGEKLEVGFRLWGRPLWTRAVDRKEIDEIVLRNDKPSPNLAFSEHDDPQYQIRGHWKLVAVTNSGKSLVLDRHVERGALEPMEHDLEVWMEEA